MSLLTSGHVEIPARSLWIADQSSSKNDWPFNLSFWHPFGWHGQESPQDILRRKRRETEQNGWTFWSFQHRPMIHDWYRELSSPATTQSVFVFCSRWEGGTDPGRPGTPNKTIDCKQYQFLGRNARWEPLPSSIRVPHPFPEGRSLASAFVVQRVHYPIESFRRPAVEWFSRTRGPWRRELVIRGTAHPYPTRGEYLLRPGGSVPMREVSAILELMPPYLAIVKV
jgi:hypothetical protein